MSLITLFLTCADNTEAKKIVDKLLADKLAACVKRAAISSDYLWVGKKQHGREVLLIIDSTEGKFDRIEAAVKAIHSYDTFVLTAYPVAKASAGVQEWVEASVK